MKKLCIALIALALMLALAVPAMAMGTKTFYAIKDGVKVYDEPSKHGSVIGKLYKGEEVEALTPSDDGKWYMLAQVGGEAWVQRKYLSENEPCDHEWSKWKVVREATCTRTDKRTRYCVLCGEEQEETIKKLPHTFGKWTVERQPTCTAEGLRSRVCKVCGYEETERIPKTPHEYGPWKVTLEATDHSSGRRTHTCEVCGTQQSEEFDPEGTLRRRDKGDDVRRLQQLLADEGYLARGGVDGSFGGATETAVKKLQRENGLEVDGIAWPQTQKLLTHNYGPWEVTTPLTRTADGQRTRTCIDCGKQETEAIPALPSFQRRARGEDVRMVQTMLNDLGYNAGSADGIYGGKLDTAFAEFAQAGGVTFEAGAVSPEDIDALTNTWLSSQSAENWKGMGNRNSDVELTLTVTPAGDDGDIRTFNWELTNLGGKRCTFNALLLGFGTNHDFLAKDVLVMALDNASLKANGGNTINGSFTASADWDTQSTGTFCFCALATDNAGGRWLSNSENCAVSK